jgi:hypothetical protein
MNILQEEQKTLRMKKSILLPLITLFLLCHLSLNAQNTNVIQCQMTIDEISLLQSFDIDHPKQEETRSIATSLIAELNLVYDELNNNITTEINGHILIIENLILSADALGMNYSMFDADLEFIETLN